MSVPPKPPSGPSGGMYQQPGGPEFAYAPQPQPQNTWGLMGLIISVIGLVGSCGLLSPIGLLLSIIGMFKEPRGMAVGGLIVGLIGTIFLAVAGLAIIGMFLAMMGLIAVASTALEHATQYAPLIDAQVVLADAWGDKDGLPDEKTGNQLLAGKTDKWGKAIKYETDGTKYSLRSAGKDSKFNTADDVVWGPFREVVRPSRFDARDPSKYPDDVLDKLPPDVREEIRKAKKLKNRTEVLPDQADPKSNQSSDGAASVANSPLSAGDNK